MSAPVFYHGTRRGFRKGGWLTPRTFHQDTAESAAPLQPGRSAAADRHEYTYVTTNPNLAWAYAYAAPGRGRPKVLIVEPHGPVESDPEHSPDMHAYRIHGWAKVIRVLTDPPFSEADSRAGWVVYD